MEFYKELLDTLEEGLSPACVTITTFNICRKEDPEEHIHLEWAMKCDEETGEIIFDRPQLALEALKLLTTPRAKYSDFVLRQVFTDEKINMEAPSFNDNLSINFDNFYHFINKLEYSEKYSDKYFIVLAPVLTEIIESGHNLRANEIAEEPIKSLMFKKSALQKEIDTWDKEPKKISLNILINEVERKFLEDHGATIQEVLTNDTNDETLTVNTEVFENEINENI